MNTIPSENDETLQVLEVAGLLDISEFRVFQQAFCSWYGHVQSRRSLEWDFEAYMFYDRVPFWVRHYCRDVLRRERAGQFDPERFGIHAHPVNRRTLFMGIVYATVPIIVLLILLLLSYSSFEDGEERGCITPPCFTEISRSKE